MAVKIRLRYRHNPQEVAAEASRWFRISMVVLAMSTVALLSALVTMRLAIHTAEVEVPNLAGMTVEEAGATSTGARLNLTVENHFYSTTVPAGRILSQSPAAGSTVRKGWHMRVTESLGPQQATIPDTVGMNEHDAGMAIRRASLDMGTLAYLPAAGTADTVLAQTPPANAEGIEKPEVGLLLSQAETAAPKVWVMPNLVGLSYSAANAKMKEMDLRVWAVVPQPAAPVADSSALPGTPAPIAPPVVLVPAGVVVTQTPAAGTRVSAGDNPHVKMSAGAPASSVASASSSAVSGSTQPLTH